MKGPAKKETLLAANVAAKAKPEWEMLIMTLSISSNETISYLWEKPEFWLKSAKKVTLLAANVAAKAKPEMEMLIMILSISTNETIF